jgi:ribonuclease HI
MIITSKPSRPPIDAAWKIHIDGATFGSNPSAIGSAGLTVWVNGLLYHAETHQKIMSTNNQAEFFALLRALRWARDHDMQHVDIYTDSDLVTKWANGKADLQNAQMLRLAAGCHHFRQYIDFSVFWVPRGDEHQSFTDYVAKLGLVNPIKAVTDSHHKLLLSAYYDTHQLALSM